MSSGAFIGRLKRPFSQPPDYSRKPVGFQWRSHTFFIVSTIGIGLFCDLFLYGLIVPVLPFLLEDRVKVPKDQIQSYTSALLAVYAGATVAISPFAGFIADHTSSRQLPFLGGLMSLIVATVLLFVGSSIPVLIFARLFQGASSAFVWTVGLALCIDTVGPENLGKTVGSMFSIITVGELFAPVLGGALYKVAGYIGVLSVAVAILAIDLFMRLLVIEKKTAARYDASAGKPNDPAEDPTQDNSENREDANEETSLLSSNKPITEEDAFAIPESARSSKYYTKLPILYPLTHSPSLILALITPFIQGILIASFDATVPTHARYLLQVDALKAGLLFAPLGFTNVTIGPLAGWAVDRLGVKPVAVVGFTWLVPAMALLYLPDMLAPQLSNGQLTALYAGLLGVCGVGLGIISSPSVVEAGAVVDKFHKRNPDFFGEQGPYAQLYSLNSICFSSGLALGPPLEGALIEKIGYGNMNCLLAVLSAATALASFVWLGGYPSVLRKVRS